MSNTSKAFALLIMMVCMTSIFTIPKQQTLGHVITKQAIAYQNRGL